MPVSFRPRLRADRERLRMTARLSSVLRSRKQSAHELLASPRFSAELARLAGRLERPLREVGTEARVAAEEIATVDNPLFGAVFDKRLGPMLTRAWTVEPDLAALEHLRQLHAAHPLVFLPTHRSYADPFILSKVLRQGGLPRNHTLGGDNLGFFPFGTIARRAGGVMIRRRFGEDEVYKLVVREYLRLLIARGSNLEWYMEGGRSRTGKLRPARYGLLRYVVDAFESGAAPDLLLVPVSITYDQLPEVRVMAAEEAGAAKAKEGLRWLAGYARGQRDWIGTVYVRFGEPLSLRDALARADREAGGRRWTVEKIAFEVFQRINRATPVTASALVTLALLGVRDRALTLAEVRGVVRPLLAYAAQRGLPSAHLEFLNDDAGLAEVLTALTRSGVVRHYEGGTEAVYGINPGQHAVAAFYRNSAIHWFVNRALMELALLSVVDDPQVDPLPRAWDRMFALRDLLKFDFFFSDRREFRAEIAAEALLLDPQYPQHLGTPAARRAILERAQFLIAQRVLPVFLEAYLVVADRLAAQPADRAVDRAALVDECSRVGRQYLLQRRLRNPEAVSRELFGNALLLADNRGLLAPGTERLAERRQAFVEEIAVAVRALAAIEELEQRRICEASA
jgi:glycerol-3-phosphate O-acyltransferase